MAYEFKVVDHKMLPGKQAVECWRDGVFVASIYPHRDGLRVISKYMLRVYQEPLDAPLAPKIQTAIIELMGKVSV